jgi:hypothetical protein
MKSDVQQMKRVRFSRLLDAALHSGSPELNAGARSGSRKIRLSASLEERIVPQRSRGHSRAGRKRPDDLSG